MSFEKLPFKLEKQFRLQNWNYSSSGFYFITICTNKHINYFGEIKNNKIKLNQIGKIVLQNWVDIPNHFSNVKLDKFVIMPNHIHGIIIVKNNAFLLDNNFQTSKNNFPTTNNNVRTPNNKFSILNDDVYINNKIILSKNSPNYSQIGKKSTQLIPMIIKTFKSSITRFCNQNNIKFQWQPRFHDRIIRNEKEYYAKKIYIKNNPANWQKNNQNKLKNIF